MNHHRCTMCKQESYPRHKYKKSGVSGVYCDDCIKIARGYAPEHHGFLFKIRSFWGRFTDWFRNLIPHQKEVVPDVKKSELARHAELKRMESYIRRLPPERQMIVHH